uniref:hypothetical protein n=1 Tax=Agathobacter sp. TaxID=2021311 RepID=UPI004056473E
MEHIKEKKGMMLFISLLILAPMVFGVLNWNAVPAELLTNLISAEGTYMKKEIIIFVVPIVFLVLYWFLMFIGVGSDTFEERQSGFQIMIAYMFCPLLSNLCAIGVYQSVFGF